MNRKILACVALVLLCASFSLVRGENSGVIAIKGAKIIPVIGEDIQEGIILIENGRIADIGANIAVPFGVTTIDAKGLTAYPGMIDSFCYRPSGNRCGESDRGFKGDGQDQSSGQSRGSDLAGFHAYSDQSV